MELKESFAIGTWKGEGEVVRELMAGSPEGERIANSRMLKYTEMRDSSGKNNEHLQDVPESMLFLCRDPRLLVTPTSSQRPEFRGADDPSAILISTVSKPIIFLRSEDSCISWLHERDCREYVPYRVGSYVSPADPFHLPAL